LTDGGMLIYPNPGSDFIEIQLKEAGHFLLRVFDCKGVFVEEKFIDGNALMDVRNYSAGLYFLEVSEISSGKKSVMKFVKI
jgi:Secretion system C-terminal sorting domain